jgi:hypothetical protein
MLRIVDYSDASVALFGDTFPIKDKCKQLGGSFNKSLTLDSGRAPGWIFTKDKKSELEALAKSTPQSDKTKKTTSSTTTSDVKSSISIDPKITHEMFANLLNKYEMLEARLIHVEKHLNLTSTTSTNNTTTNKKSKIVKKEESDEDDEEEIIKPKQRLLL